MYFRSTITGQVYKLDFIPQGTAWEAVHESEYIEYCKAHGLEVK